MTTQTQVHPPAAPQSARELRYAHPWPLGEDPSGFLAVFGGIAALVITLGLSNFAISRHADAYREAGVPSAEAAGGSILAQVLIVAVLITAGTFYRRGFDQRWVQGTAGVALLLTLVLAILPYVVAGYSWLTVLLGAVIALAHTMWFALLITFATVFVPLWWEE